VVLITDGERLRRVKAAVMRFRTRALCSSWPSTVQSARWARDMATWLHLQWRLPPPAIVFPRHLVGSCPSPTLQVYASLTFLTFRGACAPRGLRNEW